MAASPSEVVSHRKVAAEVSAGISSDAIYSMIERAIVSRNLKGKILDFGAGRGELTQRLVSTNRFDSVSAADIIISGRDDLASVEWIEQDLNEPIRGHEAAFDVVVAAEVIEHLENARFTMREIFRLLRPGGTALVTTPNNESWRSLLALLARGHFVAFGDTCYPAHITALVRKDLTRIFQEAGFASPVFSFTGDGGIPGKPNITWQRISFGTLRGLRFSDNILAAAQKPG